jgi:hypothetical protein
MVMRQVSCVTDGKGILHHKTASHRQEKVNLVSTSHDSFTIKKDINKTGLELGKRRRMLELELYKKAV